MASRPRAPGCGRTRPDRPASAQRRSSLGADVAVPDRRQADDRLLQRGRLGDAELRVEPRRLAPLDRCRLQQGPASRRPDSRASCPPSNTARAGEGAMRHFGVPSAFITGRPGLDERGKRGVPEDLLGDTPCPAPARPRRRSCPAPPAGHISSASRCTCRARRPPPGRWRRRRG